MKSKLVSPEAKIGHFLLQAKPFFFYFVINVMLCDTNGKTTKNNDK